MLNHEELKDLLNTKMPYGKYRGEPLVYLPYDYLTWFYKKGGFPKGKLGKYMDFLFDVHSDGGLEKLKEIILKANEEKNNEAQES